MQTPSPNRAPDVATSINRMLDAMLSEVHTALPATIQKYDPDKQLADVQPTILRVFVAADGTETPTPYPVLTDVPVAFPQGGGGYLTFPLAAGDPVLVVFTQRSLDAWLETDGKTPIDPGDSRRHHISNGVVWAGMSTARAPSPNISGTDVVLGLTNGDAELHIQPDGTTYLKTPKFMIGSATADKALALASQCDTRLGALESFAGTHEHPTAAPGPPSPGILPTPFTPGGGGTTTASTKVFTDA